VLLATGVTAVQSAGASRPETAPPGSGSSVVPTPVRGKTPEGVPASSATAVRSKTASNGIAYHGGPVLTAGVNVYVIWYGNWSANTSTTILPTLIAGLGGSPYNNINTTYYDGSSRRVPNSVTLADQVSDAYSQGSTNLSDGQIRTVVTSAISGGRLPSDPNGLYFVLTSADVTKSGFLTQYCGWHAHSTVGAADIKYAFVGDPGSNSACSVQTTVSPNGNPGGDAMASVIAHELEETSTDPALNAWYDSRGYENADKCAWTFGTTYPVANGSRANTSLGGLQFLIQRNWVNAAGGYCALSY
jgi:hypothetical protein